MITFFVFYLQLPDHYYRSVGGANTAPISNRRKSESKIDYTNHEQLKNEDKKEMNNTSKVDKIVVQNNGNNKTPKLNSNAPCTANTNNVNANSDANSNTNSDNEGVNEIEDDAIVHEEVHSDCEIDDEVEVEKNENENNKKHNISNIKRLVILIYSS